MNRHATAVWHGGISDGHGHITAQSGALNDTPYSFKSRFQDESGRLGTNPEELIAAAHAGCFAMALSHTLGGAGFTPGSSTPGPMSASSRRMAASPSPRAG
jgi:osmotically inducible protein OsmC